MVLEDISEPASAICKPAGHLMEAVQIKPKAMDHLPVQAFALVPVVADGTQRLVFIIKQVLKKKNLKP